MISPNWCTPKEDSTQNTLLQAGAYRWVGMVCFYGDFCSLRAAGWCGVMPERCWVSPAPLVGDGGRRGAWWLMVELRPFFPEHWKISQLSVQICWEQLMQRFTLGTACSLLAKKSLNTQFAILEERSKAGLGSFPNCLQVFAILNMVFAGIFNRC